MARMIGNTHPVDVGGKTCSCCYHPPKWRKRMNRNAKRAERQAWKKEI